MIYFWIRLNCEQSTLVGTSWTGKSDNGSVLGPQNLKYLSQVWFLELRILTLYTVWLCIRVSVPFARRNGNMTHLYFHHNNIRSLPSNLIYGSRKLRSADFEFNKLQAVRHVKQAKKVKPNNMHTIDLHRNWRMGRNLNTVSVAGLIDFYV